MVHGFKLTALNENFVESIIYLASQRDKQASITVDVGPPYSVTFNFKNNNRFLKDKHFFDAITETAVRFMVWDYFKDKFIVDKDYKLEVLI